MFVQKAFGSLNQTNHKIFKLYLNEYNINKFVLFYSLKGIKYKEKC